MKQTDPVDDDLEGMTREQLIAEVIKLRTAIRDHRDSSGHDLCWHHPDLWRTLPERVEPTSRSRRGRSSCVDASRTANRLMSKHSRPNPTTQSMTSIPQADRLPGCLGRVGPALEAGDIADAGVQDVQCSRRCR